MTAPASPDPADPRAASEGSDEVHAPPPPDPAVRRLLDANANRTREALRVMEDAARFLLDDPALTESAKQLRHDFAAALRALPHLPLNRDTPGDVGTGLTTDAERSRADVLDVAIAAGKRLSESLRCCEEYGKLIDARFAAAVKQLRYRGYELERQLHHRLARPAAPQWRLCVIVTEAMCEHHDWLALARHAVEAGADCVQLREKSLEGGELLDRAGRLVDAVGSVADVIVNDRPDVALLASAAGVHLGEHDVPIDRVRRAPLGRRLLIGASTHDLEEARRAVSAGADYCGVGAMHATATKPRSPAGVAYLKQFLEHFPGVPHLAIGGITLENVGTLVEAGVQGIAISSAVCRADDPARVVRRFRHILPD